MHLLVQPISINEMSSSAAATIASVLSARHPEGSFPPPTIAQLYTRALYDPRPTTTVISQKQLGYALGYPMDWRVERTVVVEEGPGEEQGQVTGYVNRKIEEDRDGNEEEESATTKAEKKTNTKKIVIIKDRIHALGGTKNQIKKYMWLNHSAAQQAAYRYSMEGTLESQPQEKDGTIGNTTGNTAASAAASSHLLPAKALYAKNDSVQVLYEENWWSGTITKKPKKKNDDEYLYSVHYSGDNSYQDDVEEKLLRPGENPEELAASILLGGTTTPSDDDEDTTTAGWSAVRKGSRYTLTSPDGYIFQSKQQALKYFRELLKKQKKSCTSSDNPTTDTTSTTDSSRSMKNKKGKKRKGHEDNDNSDGGGKKKKAMTDHDGNSSAITTGAGANDPPWRTKGHPFIGRRLMWTYQHQASARRTIKIDQVGTIMGYIDKNDIDKVKFVTT